MGNNNYKIRFANLKDLNKICLLSPYFKKIKLIKIKNKIIQKEIIISLFNKKIIGVIRLSYFWLVKPYMDLIYIDKRYRHQGIGQHLFQFLEKYLVKHGCLYLYSSSQANEKDPQKWHKKMGFKPCGVLTKLNLPENKQREIFFYKKIIPN